MGRHSSYQLLFCPDKVAREVVTIQMGHPVLHADVIYRWSLFDPRELTALTCGDDVIDAGDDLPADQVGRPAQHRPVVHLRARRVRQQAGGALVKEGEDRCSFTFDTCWHFY